MKKLLLSITIIIFSTFLFSCSKEESETTITGENGGQISRFQLVTVDFGSTTVPNDTYTGTFNNEPITLSKIEDNKLLFYVKESTPLGQTQLLIPSLNDTKIKYEIVEATLTQSPAATLQPLMDYQAQYGATLSNTPEDVPYLQNHNAFTQYFADLSDEDRIKAAKFYKINKTIFDAVYTTNYDAIQGRMNNQTQADFDFQLYRSLILRHKLAVATTVIAGTFAATPPYDPIETSLAAGVALAGIKISSDFHKQIIDDVLRVVQIKLNNELGINNRLSNATNAVLSLTDNQATTLPFAVNAKKFSNTDSNVQKEFVQTYFTAKNKLNGIINDLNTAINWINNNVPLLTLSTINTVEVPATAALNSFDTNAQVMQRFSFSVNHPNLSLENATLQTNGQLNLKVKFVGNPTATSISSTLNYTYNDDFSSFSGSFPIEVNLDTSTFLVGNWNLIEYNGIVPNQNNIIYNSLQNCPTNPTSEDWYGGVSFSGSASFTTTTFSCPVTRNQIAKYCLTNDCLPNLCFTQNLPNSGTYESNGNYQFNVTSNTGGSTDTTITVINQNTISINYNGILKKYSRQ